jgi:nitrite reductase/ring-hydroxylating ferredoxin subunit
MPLFKRGPSADPQGFIPIVPAADVVEDEMTTVRVGGKKVILTRHDGRLYAIDSTCPHGAADLSEGSLRRGRLCCHEHDYCFDVGSGRLVWPDDEPYRLRRYDVVEEDGVVKVRPTPIPR